MTLQTACAREPACQAIVWDMSDSGDYCWVLKSTAKPAVFNADKNLFVLEERGKAMDEQGKNPGKSRSISCPALMTSQPDREGLSQPACLSVCCHYLHYDLSLPAAFSWVPPGASRSPNIWMV